MAPRWVSAGIYLMMGWLSILAAEAILSAMPISAIVWLVTGGALFTVGAVVYLTKKPNPWPGVFGSHEVWHILSFSAAWRTSSSLLLLWRHPNEMLAPSGNRVTQDRCMAV